MTDLFEMSAKDRRDAALARVSRSGGNWQDKALVAFDLIPDFVGTAEDVRIRLMMKGLDAPHHHNAWGALIKEAIRVKVVTPTGERRAMKGARSNARRTDVYRVRGER